MLARGFWPAMRRKYKQLSLQMGRNTSYAANLAQLRRKYARQTVR
jgi:hypothetical protein